MTPVEAPAIPFDRPAPFHPPPLHSELRGVSPVMRVTTAAGEPAWAVLDGALVATVLSDSRFAITPPGSEATGSLHCDGAPHARLRRLVSRAFGTRVLDGLRPRVVEIADNLVRELVAAGPGADLVTTLALPLPLAVTAEILGIEVADRQRFHVWADAASGIAANASYEGYERAWNELNEFLGTLIDAKRTDPGADILSELVAIKDTDDGRLDDRELVMTALAVLTGGYLTVANALSIGVVTLLQAGGLAALDGEQAVTRAVEEMLRHVAGLSGEAFPRWAREDVELAGCPVAAGDMVLARLEAANHDPARIPDPGRFDAGRAPNPHLSFGHGPHHCLGAALARIELAAAVGALARHVPDLALACRPADVRWTGNPLDNGPAGLQVTW